jgi:hypothetical protein
VDLFTRLDDQFGGGHARESLIQYLSSDGDRLLSGRYTEAIGKALFSAVAEAILLAAWMTYDSAPASGLASKCSNRSVCRQFHLTAVTPRPTPLTLAHLHVPIRRCPQLMCRRFATLSSRSGQACIDHAEAPGIL